MDRSILEGLFALGVLALIAMAGIWHRRSWVLREGNEALFNAKLRGALPNANKIMHVGKGIHVVAVYDKAEHELTLYWFKTWKEAECVAWLNGKPRASVDLKNDNPFTVGDGLIAGLRKQLDADLGAVFQDNRTSQRS